MKSEDAMVVWLTIDVPKVKFNEAFNRLAHFVGAAALKLLHIPVHH